jgi:predicted anti-sigma-YlaC factor YlaD
MPMSTDEELAGCQAAREWVSAYRDGEAFDDAEAAQHLQACPACTSWLRTSDGLTGRLRLRSAEQLDLVGPALAAWREGAAGRRHRLMAAGRALLWAAAVTGLMLAASRLVGIPPLSERISAHAGRELAALEAALAVGFTLAAWRPRPYAGGLLWVALTAAGLTLLGSGADVLTGRSHLGGEVAHLLLLAGARAPPGTAGACPPARSASTSTTSTNSTCCDATGRSRPTPRSGSKTTPDPAVEPPTHSTVSPRSPTASPPTSSTI